MRWVMFDLETLATSADTAILTLGAVIFDPASDQIFDQLMIKFDVDQQLAMGRVYSESTLEWWGKQSAEMQAIAFSSDNRVSVEQAVDQFHRFVWNNDRIWSQGSFDVNIMEHLYHQLGRPVPWQYWQVRDSRTLFDLIDGALDRSKHHDALEDALAQAQAVQRALRKINWTGQPI